MATNVSQIQIQMPYLKCVWIHILLLKLLFMGFLKVDADIRLSECYSVVLQYLLNTNFKFTNF